MELLSDNIQQFFEFMNERHAVYLRRANGHPWPWTLDPILQTYKFTNVYRELDRGTVHCREAIREPYAAHPELFFNIAAYRRYNLIETQQALGYIEDYDADRYTQHMFQRRASGGQIFTGAHMLCGNIRDASGYMPPTKIEQIFNISFAILWNKRRELEPQPGDTLEMAFNRLDGKVPGYGHFITYEVITDLRWTRYLCNAADILTWANPGPGAIRGIVRLMGQDARHGTKDFPSRAECIMAMRTLLELSPEYLAYWMDPLEMRDVEHSLCEWDKYMRVLTGEGKPRSKFVPPQLR
jgi:hypothetical protein